MYRLEFGPSTALIFWKINLHKRVILIFSPIITFFPFRFQAQQKYPSYLPSLKQTVLMFIFVPFLVLHLHAPLILSLCPSHLPYFQNILLYDLFLLLMLKSLYLIFKRKLICDSCLNYYLPASHHCYASLKMFCIFCLLLPHLCNPDFAFVIVLKIILE